MQMHRIGQSAVALMIEGEELRRRNITPEDIDERQAASLLESTGWRGAQFELFTGKDCVLLFAWENADTPYVFEFGTLEELLGGIRTCPDYPSQLLLYGESYILVIYTTGSDEPLRYLYEFGEPKNASEAFLAHIEEQGKVLAASDAVKTLKTLLSV